MFEVPHVPQFPTYSVIGAPGQRFITSADLRRFCRRRGFPLPDGDDRDTIFDVVPEKFRLAASVSGDEVKKVDLKNASSSIFVSEQWIRKSPKLSRNADLLEDAVPGLPIVTGTHPPNRGTKTFSRKSEPTVQATVKCGLKGKLRDARAREVLESLVDNLSKASRTGSLAVTLTVATVLRDSNGRFPPDFNLLPTQKGVSKSANILHAMRRAHKDSKPLRVDASNACTTAIDKMFRDHEDSFSGLRCDLRNGGNSLKRDADDYVTSLMTSIQKHGGGRVAALLSSVARLEGASQKKLVYPTVRFIESQTDSLPPALPQSMVNIAKKFRTIYAEKGLHDKHGFNVHKIIGASAISARVNAVLELYYEINEEHVAVEKRAESHGWTIVSPDEADEMSPEELADARAAEEADALEEEDNCQEGDVDNTESKRKVWRSGLFAMLPISGLRRRHVRVDTDVFTTILFKKLYDMNIEGLEKDAFLSLFGGTKKRSALQLRSKRKGWVIGRSFTTDGTALCVPFFNSEKERARAEKKACDDDPPIIITASDTVAGGDPGRVTMLKVAIPPTPGRQPVIGGKFKFKSLEREDYMRRSGQLATEASRASRAKHHASEALAALSSTRRKTHWPSELLAYIRACSEHAGALKRAYSCRNASGEQFMNYRMKPKVVDRFLANLPPRDTPVPDRGRFVLGLGNAKIGSTGRGERSVPTTWIERRIDRCFRKSITRIGVGEHNTTKKCCQCHESLSVVRRWHTFRDGTARLVTDRDVRVCTSNQCLRSHPSPAREDQLRETLHAPDLAKGMVVCRDGNSSVSFHHLAGKTEAERPQAFKS